MAEMDNNEPTIAQQDQQAEQHQHPQQNIFYIFGRAISSSKSPQMHNAAFAALGIDAVYLAFDVLPEALPAAIAGARALGVRQLAVSLPHKEDVIQLLDEVDDVARRIGAVNTVTLREGRIEIFGGPVS